MRKLFMLILSASMLLGGCVKDQNTVTKEQKDFFSPVIASLIGTVKAVDNRPIPNAKVTSGSLVAYTDEFGVYVFDDVVVNQNGQMVIIEKDGFVPQSVYYLPSDHSVEMQQVQLRNFSTDRLSSAQNGGVLLNSQEIQITLPSSALQNQSGQLFQGTLQYDLNVAHQQVNEIIFYGNPIARDLNNNPVIVSPEATFNFSLKDESGNPLSLIKPISGKVDFPSIGLKSLWHLDDLDQTWKEVQIFSSNDEFEIPSSGSFMIGSSYAATRLTGNISVKDLPVQNEIVQMSYGDNYTYHIYANNAGEYNIYVPLNERLTLTPVVVDGQNPYAKEFIANGSELNKQDFEVDQFLFVQFSTQLVSCGFNELESGYVLFESGQPAWVTDSGFVRINLFHENSDSLKFRAINLDESQKSIGFTAEINNDRVDFPLIKVCDDFAGQYLTYSMDGYRSWTHEPIGGKNGNELIIYADIQDFQNPANFQDFVISIPDIGTGKHVVESAEIFWEDVLDTKYGKCQGGCGSRLSVDISVYGNQVGDHVMGKLTGIIAHPVSGVEYEIQADFNVVRSF